MSSNSSSERPSVAESSYSDEFSERDYPGPPHSRRPKQAFSATEEVAVRSERDERPYSIYSKMAAEFIGDLIFVFVGSSQALVQQPSGMINAAFAHGITIFVIVCSLGHVSGGHFNPAITLAITLCGKLKPIYLIPYVFSQLLGGFCGALIVRAMTRELQYHAIKGGTTLVEDDCYWYQGFIAEIMVTYFLTQTVMLTAVDTSSNVLAPLAIGFTLTLDIFAVGRISGASMNPARSFGPAAVSSIFGIGRPLHYIWKDHYVYWIGPMLGACITSALYWTFFRRSSKRLAP